MSVHYCLHSPFAAAAMAPQPLRSDVGSAASVQQAGSFISPTAAQSLARFSASPSQTALPAQANQKPQGFFGWLFSPITWAWNTLWGGLVRLFGVQQTDGSAEAGKNSQHQPPSSTGLETALEPVDSPDLAVRPPVAPIEPDSLAKPDFSAAASSSGFSHSTTPSTQALQSAQALSDRLQQQRPGQRHTTVQQIIQQPDRSIVSEEGRTASLQHALLANGHVNVSTLPRKADSPHTVDAAAFLKPYLENVLLKQPTDQLPQYAIIVNQQADVVALMQGMADLLSPEYVAHIARVKGLAENDLVHTVGLLMTRFIQASPDYVDRAVGSNDLAFLKQFEPQKVGNYQYSFTEAAKLAFGKLSAHQQADPRIRKVYALTYHTFYPVQDLTPGSEAYQTRVAHEQRDLEKFFGLSAGEALRLANNEAIRLDGRIHKNKLAKPRP
ncbi:MAG: hypothetical protein SFZ03_03470 [Candidatus Melainabacteria bacterium]|nr:hypothetical protein [Candidatus Melainabacteria bacterium]